MIRYLNEWEKPDSRNLWKEAFPEDSEAFTDYYYKEKMQDNRVLAIVEEDRIQSMVHLNPYAVRVRDFVWKAEYLVGVATRAKKRHQGYMRRLLLFAMEDMRRAQMPFCFLMPAAEAIYRPFGFTYIFKQQSRQLKQEAMQGLKKRRWCRECEEEALAWLDGWLRSQYEVYAVRDEAYMHRLLHEIASEDGRLDLLYREERLMGLYGEWGLAKKEQRLLYCDAKYCEVAGEAAPAIMARILDVEQFVKAIRLKKEVSEQVYRIRLCLKDEVIRENCGLWDWELDHDSSFLRRSAEMREDEEWYHAAETGQEEPMLCLTIEELTAWLFGYAVPDAALPYAEIVDVLDGVFLDEVV